MTRLTFSEHLRRTMPPLNRLNPIQKMQVFMTIIARQPSIQHKTCTDQDSDLKKAHQSPMKSNHVTIRSPNGRRSYSQITHDRKNQIISIILRSFVSEKLHKMWQKMEFHERSEWSWVGWAWLAGWAGVGCAAFAAAVPPLPWLCRFCCGCPAFAVAMPPLLWLCCLAVRVRAVSYQRLLMDRNYSSNDYI